MISCGFGFFDIEKAKSEEIVGKLSVLIPNLPEDTGSYLIFETTSRDSFPLKYAPIDYIKSNDSIMLVKTKADPESEYYVIYHDNGDSTKTVAYPDIAYYIIHHNEGNIILSIQKISDSLFSNYEHAIKTKYYFSADKWKAENSGR